MGQIEEINHVPVRQSLYVGRGNKTGYLCIVDKPTLDDSLLTELKHDLNLLREQEQAPPEQNKTLQSFVYLLDERTDSLPEDLLFFPLLCALIRQCLLQRSLEVDVLLQRSHGHCDFLPHRLVRFAFFVIVLLLSLCERNLKFLQDHLK